MTNKQTFKALANYVHLFDGYGKPRIDFQELYRLFPSFEFNAGSEFGSYEHFGEAFEQKNYDMEVTANGYTAYLHYRVYFDADENSAYLTF